MTGAPELKRANRSDQDVKHERGRANDGRCDSEQRHRGDVARRTRMAHRRVQKCDHPDGGKKKDELRRVHKMTNDE